MKNLLYECILDLQSFPCVAAMLDDIAKESNEKSFLIVIQHGGQNQAASSVFKKYSRFYFDIQEHIPLTTNQSSPMFLINQALNSVDSNLAKKKRKKKVQ
jgi:creatinine amidohydrolase/Fe(II)-dependent formamide hydrolase-like protein